MSEDIYNIGNKTMQYLLAVKAHKNITAAANALYISQPALSKYLQNLESRLGFCLFNRVGYQFHLTYEGQRFLEYAQRIDALEQSLTDEITSWKTEYTGRLRLAIPRLRSQYLLPKLIPPFMKQYPKVQIELFEDNSDCLENMLADGSADFAILNARPKRPDTVVDIIRRDPLLLALPADHPLCASAQYASGGWPKLDLMLLRDEPFILQSPAQRTRQAAEQIFEQLRMTPHILFTVKSIEATVNLVAQGCGVCFLAESYVRNLHLDKMPRFFSPLQETPMIELSIAHTKNLYMPEHFKSFLRLVKECI